MKKIILLLLLSALLAGCRNRNTKQLVMTAADILGNPAYPAMSYGGYRAATRDTVPTVEDIKEDMRLLAAMNIKLIRTYDTGGGQMPNLLKAIKELQKEDPDFEMYLMLGAWIQCKNAQTDSVCHAEEDLAGNTAEIERAVQIARDYPEIVKCIAVGNECMVHWAASYYVSPKVILHWVEYLQQKKADGELPASLWITCSDNFASWGGGSEEYHTDDLKALINAVDFLSIHTYPFHDSYYNPEYWTVPEAERTLSPAEQADRAVNRAVEYAVGQYRQVLAYLDELEVNKPVHIGETGWATQDGPSKRESQSSDISLASFLVTDDLSMYGIGGTGAADEYKAKAYYDGLCEWCSRNRVTCFYFEAFDEPWKDKYNAQGSENHFGLMEGNLAKYVLWDLVDQGAFESLTRGGKPIGKTFDGDVKALKESILPIRGK